MQAYASIQIARSEQASSRQYRDNLISLVIVAGVTYNTFLAVLNAFGVHQTFGSVAATEALILGFATTIVVLSGLKQSDSSAIAFGVFSAAIAIYASLVNQTVYVDCLRNVSIICIFTMLGARISASAIRRVFLAISLCVSFFLIVELFNTDLYVKLFQPALYYLNTRGIEEFSLDDTGLFRNALGFEDRFSFGLSTHRTASIFIDQVSLANYAAVLCVYLLSFFPSLSRRDRCIHILTIITILLTNNSRTSLFLAIASLAGFYIYPKMSTFLVSLIMPSILAIGFSIYLWKGSSGGDDIVGRISITMDHLQSFDLAALFGLAINRLPEFMDSGYAYVLASLTLIGLIYFYIFCARVIVIDSKVCKRCLFGLNMYVFVNLMIGGTAIFSIKVAAPLWIIVGYVRSMDANSYSDNFVDKMLVSET